MSATCRSCKAPIVWVRTENGKNMPIDATPNESGNIVLEPASDPREAPTAVIDVRRVIAGDRYTSHFATCPNAASHRKRGG